QILLPGEIAAPGTATGKTAATPTAQTAAIAITNGIVVNAVDANWNIVPSAVPNVTISSTDTNAIIADDNGVTAGHMTLVAGTGTGKTGSPTSETAGTGYSVTINAVDADWNVVASVTDTVGISSTDANAALPATTALVAGTRSLSLTNKTVGTWTLTATDTSDGSKVANTSPPITVNAGAVTKLQ